VVAEARWLNHHSAEHLINNDVGRDIQS